MDAENLYALQDDQQQQMETVDPAQDYSYIEHMNSDSNINNFIPQQHFDRGKNYRDNPQDYA